MHIFHTYVREIFWDRVFLNIKIELPLDIASREDLKFYFINKEGFAETELEILKKDNIYFTVKVNVTNSGINRCINNGEYQLLITNEINIYSLAEFQGKERYLANNNLCLRYLNNIGAYTVTFNMNENTEKPILNFLFYNTNKKNMEYMEPQKLNYKEDKLHKYILKAQQTIKKIMRNKKRKAVKICYEFFRTILSNKSRKRILFLSEQDNILAQNMRCLYERMLERDIDKNFKILFSLRKKTSEKVSVLSSIEMFFKLCVANIIIIDDHVPVFDWLLLKNTKLIQIWHAGAGFKGVGYSRWGHKGAPGPFSCHRQYSYCISGSQKIAHFFSEQFGILDEQILPTGMPRMDKYIDENNKKYTIQQLMEKYPFLINKKIILFAPTYRGQNRENAYYPYDKIDFQEMYNFCKADDAIVLFKMHPWVSDPVPIESKFQDRLFDFSNYKDINELFYITDILITDYSSSMYEYALMNKPMLAYAYDKIQYSLTRGFHRSYDNNVPGKVCENFPDLLKALKEQDYQYYKHEQYINNHFEFIDTNNRDRVIDWLILDKLPDIYVNALNNKIKRVREVRNKNFMYLFEGGKED